MMKRKDRMTHRDVKSLPGDMIAIGYCDAQELLSGHEPIAYTAGVYGWNYDVYRINGVTICTGYRNMPGRKPRNLHEYEEKARKIWSDCRGVGHNYTVREELTEELLQEFLRQA